MNEINQGQTHYSTDIIANEMQMLGGRGGQGGGGDFGGGNNRSQGANQGSNQGGGQSRAPAGGADFDDDIPF